ncbi:hypothetical protein ACFYU4_17400 [Streptomyces tendae]
MALLDWRAAKHFDSSGDKPCVLCDKPTPLRSPRPAIGGTQRR